MPATLAIVDVELGPVERATGVAYVADAQLEAGAALNVGDRLTLRDEGQCLYETVVEQVAPGMYGNRYRTKFSAA